MGERGEALPPSPAGAELIDFTVERQRHRRFVGREDVLAQLDEWLLGPGEAGWVVVTGGPGMGKSAVLSAWLARREAAGAAVPHHFVRSVAPASFDNTLKVWDADSARAPSLTAPRLLLRGHHDRDCHRWRRHRCQLVPRLAVTQSAREREPQRSRS